MLGFPHEGRALSRAAVSVVVLGIVFWFAGIARTRPSAFSMFDPLLLS